MSVNNNKVFVIARCRNAGVHAGYLQDRSNGVVRLKGARRLWKWWSKATLSELAIYGPLQSRIDEQKYGAPVDVDLTESDVCEIIYCSEIAEKAILAVKEWSNE
jgi:hypothetical protein